MSAAHLASIFMCPLCNGTFTVRSGRTLVCPDMHAFDVAREGYVNLIPAQAKNSKEPGYNKELMQARHEFFETDGYGPVAAAMADMTLAAASSDTARILDAGCGEGYYLRVLRDYAPQFDIVGTDVSRFGMRTASRLDPTGAFAVANSYHLPLPDSSVDILISHFSPNPIDEFARVLRPGGSLLIGSPGADHLFSLKAAVYETPRRHDEEKHGVHDRRFVHSERKVVRYALSISDSRTLDALFGMTPYSYGAIDRGQLPRSTGSTFDTEVHVLFDLYRLGA